MEAALLIRGYANARVVAKAFTHVYATCIKTQPWITSISHVPPVRYVAGAAIAHVRKLTCLITPVPTAREGASSAADRLGFSPRESARKAQSHPRLVSRQLLEGVTWEWLKPDAREELLRAIDAAVGSSLDNTCRRGGSTLSTENMDHVDRGLGGGGSRGTEDEDNV